MKTILLIFLISFQCFAQDIVPIKKGEVSPIDGYVISKKLNQKIIEDREALEHKNLKLKDLAVLQDEALSDMEKHKDTLVKHNNELRESLKEKPTGFWEKTGYFVLGALITGAISYGTIKAVR